MIRYNGEKLAKYTHIEFSGEFEINHHDPTIEFEDCIIETLIISGKTQVVIASCSIDNLIIKSCNNLSIISSSIQSIKTEGNLGKIRVLKCLITKSLEINQNVKDSNVSETKINKLIILNSLGLFTIEDSLINELLIIKTKTNGKNSKLEFTGVEVLKRVMIGDSILDDSVFNRFNCKNSKYYQYRSSIENGKFYSIKWMASFKVELINFSSQIDQAWIDLFKDKLDIRELVIFKNVAKEANSITLRKEISGIFTNKNEVYTNPKHFNRYLWDTREAYRQLKVISLKSDNRLDALKFNQGELNTTLKEEWLTTKERIYNCTNWILLFTNKHFTSFGQSWTRPLFWLFLMNLVFFQVFYLDKLGIKISYKEIDSEITQKAFSYFFNLLSPIHSSTIENISGKEVSLYSVSDFFQRILSSYFIYNFIRGTRKYNF